MAAEAEVPTAKVETPAQKSKRATFRVTFTNGRDVLVTKEVAKSYAGKLKAYQNGDVAHCNVAKVDGV